MRYVVLRTQLHPEVSWHPSVRSTNVYEDQSLGIFRDDDEETSEEAVSLAGSRAWGRYLAKHARQQLSFGMYPASNGARLPLMIHRVCRYVVAWACSVPRLHH